LHAIYVGNFCIIADSASCSRSTAKQMRAELEAARLPTHENIDSSTEVDFVGLHFDGKRHTVSLSLGSGFGNFALRFLLV
jgi:hypothetical protein